MSRPAVKRDPIAVRVALLVEACKTLHGLWWVLKTDGWEGAWREEIGTFLARVEAECVANPLGDRAKEARC